MDYTWKIYNLKRTISDDVVNEISYGCIATSSSYSNRKISNLEITGSASDPGFIPYDDLTEGIVLSWVTGSIDKSSFELETSSSLANVIRDIEGKTEETGTPW